MKERAIITPGLIRQVQLMLAGGATGKEVAEITGTSEGTISRIKKAGFDYEQFQKNTEARRKKMEEAFDEMNRQFPEMAPQPEQLELQGGVDYQVIEYTGSSLGVTVTNGFEGTATFDVQIINDKLPLLTIQAESESNSAAVPVSGRNSRIHIPSPSRVKGYSFSSRRMETSLASAASITIRQLPSSRRMAPSLLSTGLKHRAVSR